MSPIGTGGSGTGGNKPPPIPRQPINTAVNSAALDAETNKLIDNSKALSEDAKNYENLARLRSQKPPETFTEMLKRETQALKEAAVAMGQYRRYVAESFSAVKGLMTEMQTLTSMTAIYDRTIDQLSTSTASYTASLQANTDNVGEATEQATKFFHATRAAAAEAENLAAKYNMQSQEINAATKQATAMFATQLGAMGNVEAGVKSLQNNMVVLGRYLGVDSKEIVDSWNERMAASNMTLEEAQLETAMLTKVTDQYAKALTSVGGEILKTAKVGKKELFEMTKAVNHEFKIGIPNVVAYTAAMSKMAVAAAKLGGTKNEQKEAMEGVVKLGKSLTTMQGGFGLMGMLGAEKLWQQFKTSPESLSAGLRDRLGKRAGMIEGAPDIMKRQYIMETAGGSSEMMRAAMKELRDRAGGDVDKLAAMTQGDLGVSAVTARTLAEATIGGKEGDLDKALKEYEESNKTDAQKQLDKAEELAKQGAKTNDILASSAQTLREIKHWVMAAAIGNPILSAVAGPLAGKLLGGVLGLGTKAAAGTAITSAASTAAAGTIVTGGAGAGAAGAGLSLAAVKAAALAAAPAVAGVVVAGAALYGGYKAYKAITSAQQDNADKESRGQRGTDLSTRFTNWATGKKDTEVVQSISFKELDQRKQLIKKRAEEIKVLEEKAKTDKGLSEEDKRILAAKVKEKERVEKSISAITEREQKQAEIDKATHSDRMSAGVKRNIMEGAGNVTSKLKEKGKGAGSLQDLAWNFVSNMGENILKHGDTNTEIAKFLEGDSAEAKQLKEQLAASGYSEGAFKEAISMRVGFHQMGGGGAGLKEDILNDPSKFAEEWDKRGMGASTPVVPFSDDQKRSMSRGSALSISMAGGESESDIIEPIRDASDNITLTMPGQKIKINGGKLSNDLAGINSRNSNVGA